jgi:hypothetical protein
MMRFGKIIDRRGRGFAAGRWISQRPHGHPRHHHRRVHVNARHGSVRISFSRTHAARLPSKAGFSQGPLMLVFLTRAVPLKDDSANAPQDQHNLI